MAKSKNKKVEKIGKKTKQGNGKFTKWYSKGGGSRGSTPSKLYRKKPRGQG